MEFMSLLRSCDKPASVYGKYIIIRDLSCQKSGICYDLALSSGMAISLRMCCRSALLGVTTWLSHGYHDVIIVW
jgi:hypothetical protein